MRYILFLYAVCCPFYIRAQALQQKLSSGFAAAAVYSNAFTDVFSGTYNQAAFSKLKVPVFGVTAERRFMLKEMSQFTGVVAVPGRGSVFALQSEYFGSADFNESMLGIAYARKITSAIAIGSKINWYNVRVAGYGGAACFNVEFGTTVNLTQQLTAGLHVYNPTGSRLGKNIGEKLPSVVKAGFGYQPSEQLLIAAEVVRRENQPVSLQSGIQYKLHERIIVRGGISTMNSGNYLGIGVVAGLWRVDINAGYHQQLGFTPGIAFLCNLTKHATD